jgi:hypothetical protein
MSLSRTSLPFQCPSNHLFFLPFVVISLMFLLFSSIAWFRLLFFLFRSLHIIVSSVFILLVMKQQFQLLFYCRVFISVPLCPLQSVSCFISPLKPLSMCSFFSSQYTTLCNYFLHLFLLLHVLISFFKCTFSFPIFFLFIVLLYILVLHTRIHVYIFIFCFFIASFC